MTNVSPVPAQTTFGSEGAIASDPTEATSTSSKTGCQRRPPSVVFQMPPRQRRYRRHGRFRARPRSRWSGSRPDRSSDRRAESEAPGLEPGRGSSLQVVSSIHLQTELDSACRALWFSLSRVRPMPQSHCGDELESSRGLGAPPSRREASMLLRRSSRHRTVW